MSKVKVVFTPSGKKGEIEKGTYILTASRILGVDLASVCGGNGQCTQCKIQLSTGDFPKHQITSDASHLSEITSSETCKLNKDEFADGYRLGCQTKIMGDVVIDIDAIAKGEAQQQQPNDDGFVLHRISDGVTSRSIHAGILDAYRLAIGF